MFTHKLPAEPLALSTVAPYTSWSSLNDHARLRRYLPPRPAADLPPIDEVMELFKVGRDGPRLSRHSTLLFPCFAQWFTDSFMMIDGSDTRRITSNHQIDLSQVYGLTPHVTRVLRCNCEQPGQRGRLKSEIIDSEEWAPRLFNETGHRQAEFVALLAPLRLPDDWPAEKRAGLFAFGGECANATPFSAMLNTLFLREHNRLCALLEHGYPDWDDERVFETARNVNIVQLIKVVIEEYINHISPYWFRLLADPRDWHRAGWIHQSWIPVEFDLLYRWHSLVPERACWDDQTMLLADMQLDNRLLLHNGLATGFRNASRTKAWQVGLFNTPDFLLPAERASIAQDRGNQLAGYNDYRQMMGYPRVTRFEQISGDPHVVEGLRGVYGHVDRVEFFVGLFAEEPRGHATMPELIGRMVLANTFSHALPNPLLSPHVFNEETFSRQGMRSIAATAKLQDLLERNALWSTACPVASMQQDGADMVA